MSIELVVLLRVALAAVLGGAVGFERQRRDKPAGLRTHMLVAMGSALFVGSGLMVLGEFGDGSEATRLDVLRISAAVATGIGFLGAGTIIQAGGGIRGLTTAAGIWVTAGIGIATGLGQYWLAVGSTALAVVIIALLSSDIIPETYTSHSGDQ